ncbi:MAG TPA: hypothetical protein VF154_15435, partial [Terriglobales bacterium]
MPARRYWVFLALCSTLLFAADVNDRTAPLYGYSAAHSRAEEQWEAKFRAIPDPNVLRTDMQLLSA